MSTLPPSPATAPPEPRPIDVIGNLNLERELNPDFRPDSVFRDQIDDVANRIEMTSNGPIGYTLDGMKIDSHTARTFLDNKTRTDRLFSDPSLAEAPRRIMTIDTQRSALKDFVEYTEYENATLPIPEVFRKGTRVVKMIGNLALQGAEGVAGAAAEASKASKAAMVRARQVSADVAYATALTALELGYKSKRFAAKRYARVGAFATGIRADMPELLKDLHDTKDLDKTFYNFANYDSDNAREVAKRTIRRASINLSGASKAKEVVKNSWKNRKA